MAIYTNENLTDLLNEQYEKVRKLEKENARLDEENHKLAYSLSQYQFQLNHLLSSMIELRSLRRL